MSRAIAIETGANCKITVEPKANMLAVKISGWINEDVNFSKIADTLMLSGSKTVEFDMLDVSQINSCGVREWLLFMEKIQMQLSTRFDSIGEVFIEQANIVPNLLGKGGTDVRMIQVPYYCARCQNRVLKIVSPTKVTSGQAGFSAPSETCPRCKSVLEFDGVEAEYFNFLKHLKQ